MEALLVLTQAKITICSSSTFCFWAALSKRNGTAYFPVSRLVLAGNERTLCRLLLTHSAASSFVHERRLPWGGRLRMIAQPRMIVFAKHAHNVSAMIALLREYPKTGVQLL
jgi:hypothetical protein